jgi:ribosomal protein L7/L12
MLTAPCLAATAGFMSPIAAPGHSKVAASKVHMSAAVDEVMEKLKSMTLLEASELVKAIEETFDVDASAGGGGGMMMMAPGAGGGADAGGAAAEEKTEFDLVLESFPADKKIAVLKVRRTRALAHIALLAFRPPLPVLMRARGVCSLACCSNGRWCAGSLGWG